MDGAVGNALDLLHRLVEGTDDGLVIVAVLDLLLGGQADVVDDVVDLDAEGAVFVDGGFSGPVEQVEGQTVAVFREVAHPVRDQLVILGQEVAHVLREGDMHLAGVFFDVGFRGEVGDVEGFKVFFEGFGGDLHAGDGLHVFFQLAVGGVPAFQACPRHVFLDGEGGGVVPPVVGVAPHQGVDQQAVSRPAELFRVGFHRLEDEGHLIVLVAVADVLVAVGVRLIVGDGDAVGCGVELPPPLHVGPNAADEIGGGAVAQNVVFLHPFRHRGLEGVQQRGGEGHALWRALRDDGGHGFRVGEGTGLQVGVHNGVDVGKIVGVQLVAEFAGVFLLKGFELAVDGQHFLKLLRFQKTQRLTPELVHGRGILRHGKALL